MERQSSLWQTVTPAMENSILRSGARLRLHAASVAAEQAASGDETSLDGRPKADTRLRAHSGCPAKFRRIRKENSFTAQGLIEVASSPNCRAASHGGSAALPPATPCDD